MALPGEQAGAPAAGGAADGAAPAHEAAQAEPTAAKAKADAGLAPGASPERAEADGDALDRLQALIDDLFTYALAEWFYQKSRLAFLVQSIRRLVGLVLAALLLLFLAVVGLIVGLLLSLEPLIGPWAATGLVVGLMLLIAIALVRVAGRTWSKARASLLDDQPPL